MGSISIKRTKVCKTSQIIRKGGTYEKNRYLERGNTCANDCRDS